MELSGEQFCEKYFDCKENPMELPYGAWIRAPNKRGTNQIGERWLRDNAPAPVGSNKNPMVEDFMHIEKVDSYFQAKGKEVRADKKEVGDNSGADKASLTTGRELRIASNLNYNCDELANEGQKESAVILDPKRRCMVDIQDKENINVLGIESSGILLNHDKSKNMDVAGLGFQACQDQ